MTSMVLPRITTRWYFAGSAVMGLSPVLDASGWGQDQLPPVDFQVGAEVGDQPGVDDPVVEADTHVGVVVLRTVPLEYLRPGADRPDRRPALPLGEDHVPGPRRGQGERCLQHERPQEEPVVVPGVGALGLQQPLWVRHPRRMDGPHDHEDGEGDAGEARLLSTTRETSRNPDSGEPARRRWLSRSNTSPGATSRKNRRTDSQLPGTTGY
jgi:hypothetical protein